MNDDILPTGQLDLLVDYDAEAKAAAERDRWITQNSAPKTCPNCGGVEPNGFLLRNNHGVDWETGTISGYPFGHHPIYGDQCLAQSLVTNQIAYAVKTQSDSLDDDVDRGRKLGLDTAAIIADVRAAMEGE